MGFDVSAPTQNHPDALENALPQVDGRGEEEGEAARAGAGEALRAHIASFGGEEPAAGQELLLPRGGEEQEGQGVQNIDTHFGRTAEGPPRNGGGVSFPSLLHI